MIKEGCGPAGSPQRWWLNGLMAPPPAQAQWPWASEPLSPWGHIKGLRVWNFRLDPLQL